MFEQKKEKEIPYEKQGKVTLFHISWEKKSEGTIYYEDRKCKKGAPISEELFYKLWSPFS